MSRKVLWLFLSCVLTNSLTNGLTSEETSEVTETCCSSGEAYAVTNPGSCDSAPLPEDIEPELLVTCKTALRSCCKEQHKQKTDCTAAFKFAETKRCGVPSTEIGKTCCEECSLGRWTGESQGKEACGAPASVEDYSPTTTLRKNAYYQCCLEAANKPETTTQRRTTTTSTTTPKPTTTTRKPEKCAPKSPCDQLCNDDYGRVTCACYEGYRLQPDKRSCKDINECAEADDDLCVAEGTVCHNTPGAFKCVPLRKRDVSMSCPPGFKKDTVNQVCNDINECQLPRPPCPKYLCVNTIGGYKCAGKAMKPAPEGATTPAPNPGPGSGMCPPGFRDGPDDDCVDIDECAETQDDCQRLSQHCINTHGGFFCQDFVSKRCAPGFKVDGAGVCQDIDECVESTEVCHRNEVCVNLPGAYDCKSKISTLPKLNSPKTCAEGMRTRSGGAGCEDIDECREGSHLCDQFQNCINTYGGHECRCKQGFELDSTSGSCVDIDECALKMDNCPAGLHCLNVLGTFTCSRGPTSTTLPPSEYEYYYSDEDNSTIDDVTDDKPVPNQPAPQRPPTTPKPRPRPIARPRPTTTNAPVTTTSTTPVPPRATPAPRTTPAPTTTPAPRTTPAPTTTPIPSTTVPPPPPLITPPPERPTYSPFKPRTTTVRPPWRPYTNKPTPRRPEIEEVLVPEPEDALTVEKDKDNGVVNVDTGALPKNRWTNVIGRDPKDVEVDQVHCLNGYEKDLDGNCVDVDECSTRRYICSSLEVCKNEPGGYSCECMAGFERDASGWCVARTPERVPARPASIPERAPARPASTLERVPARPASTTERTTTSRTTVAAPTPTRPYSPPAWGAPTLPTAVECDELGYMFDASLGRCLDIDECAIGRASCAQNERCVNTDGGYKCVYDRERPYDRPSYSRPYDRPGYERPAYERPSYVQPRPAQPAPTGSNIITVGSQYGKRGYEKMAPIFKRLQDSGMVQVSCPWGYELLENESGSEVCSDIDECGKGTAECGPQQRCENFFGGYSCQCPAGHRLAGGAGGAGHNTCEDIDECSFGNPCSTYADCVNTQGSYRCDCHQGFRTSPTNDKMCEDLDECARAGVCEQGCTNTWGGYRCTCNRGYKLASDNSTCMDVDECAAAAAAAAGRRGRLCIGECVNTPGTFKCACPSGYRLSEDGRSCVDIDECETGEASCANGSDPELVCQNTRGGYHCHKVDCPLGYRLEKKHRCIRIQRSCPMSDWACLRRPSTYSYHFISFTSQIYLPGGGVDLFTMHGPAWQDSMVSFEMKMMNVQAPAGVRPADLSCFDMRPTNNVCVITLVCSLEGPQVAEMELSMSLHQQGQFAGSAVARLVVIVSRYEY